MDQSLRELRDHKYMKIVSLAPETLGRNTKMKIQEGRQVEVLTGKDKRVSAARYFAYIQKEQGSLRGVAIAKRHVG